MKFADIEKFIKEAQDGLYDRDSIVEFIEKVTRMMEEANLEVVDIEQKNQEMSSVKDIEETSGDAEMSDITCCTAELEQARENRSRCSLYLGQLEDVLSTYKNFDKNRFFSNMRYLLKKTDSKIGQIEKEAGVRLGYASRLEKEGNTSAPSIEFVVTAAKVLEITLDFLLTAKIEEMTPNEEYILKFLNSVLEDTKADILMWKREGSKIFNTPFQFNEYSDSEPHPLFTIADEDIDGYGNPQSAAFYSLFFPEKNAVVTDNVYSTPLPRTQNTLYIVPCSIYTQMDSEGCYELYITGEDPKLTPLCSTMLTCNVVAEAVRNLYLHAENNCSHIQVTQNTRTIIDAYMGTGAPIPKSFKKKKTDSFMDIDEDLPFN